MGWRCAALWLFVVGGCGRSDADLRGDTRTVGEVGAVRAVARLEGRYERERHLGGRLGFSTPTETEDWTLSYALEGDARVLLATLGSQAVNALIQCFYSAEMYDRQTAALLQDAGRAPIVGAPTCGKGVARALRLADGRVTHAQDYRVVRADGRPLSAGVAPDHVTPQALRAARQLHA